MPIPENNIGTTFSIRTCISDPLIIVEYTSDYIKNSNEKWNQNKKNFDGCVKS